MHFLQLLFFLSKLRLQLLPRLVQTLDSSCHSFLGRPGRDLTQADKKISIIFGQNKKKARQEKKNQLVKGKMLNYQILTLFFDTFSYV